VCLPVCARTCVYVCVLVCVLVCVRAPVGLAWMLVVSNYSILNLLNYCWRRLDVRGCQGITAEALENISRMLPNCNFIYSNVN